MLPLSLTADIVPLSDEPSKLKMALKKLLLGLFFFIPSSILAHEGPHSHQNELMNSFWHPFQSEFTPAALILAVIMILRVVYLSRKNK